MTLQTGSFSCLYLFYFFFKKESRDSVRFCYQKRMLKDGEKHTHAFREKLLLADFGGFWPLFGRRERL